MSTDLPPIEAVEALTHRAGRRILEIYDRGFEVVTKDDDSPLTQADLASHRCICDGLATLTPEIPVLSEESRSIPWETRRQWSRYWLVDPLDGTKEFIKRNGEFTVNIALIEGHRARLGVVHVPVRGVTFTGVPGHGAWREDDDGRHEIRVRQPARQPPVIVASRNHATPELETYLERVGEHERISMGSSLKFCRVAEGEADAYPRIGLTSEWDTAAAQAVVEAAGGAVVKLDGQPLEYNTKDDILNPFFIVYGDDAIDWAAFSRA